MARLRFALTWVVAAAVCLIAASGARDVSAGGPSTPHIEAPFDEEYEVNVLDEVPGLPEAYAGLTFMADDPNTLLIGESAGDGLGGVYRVGVERNAEQHITGFVGQAERYADAPYIDGGLAYGPDGVLFYSRFNFPLVEMGQIKPGSDTTDRVIDLEPLGVNTTSGGLNFVPPGFPGEGALKLTSHGDGDWYELAISPAGDGTYDVTSATNRADLQGGSENMSFVPAGSPFFGGGTHYALVNGGQTVAAYDLDANGDPVPSSRNVFMTEVDGAEGSAFDPLTGDLLITDNNNPRLYQVTGFSPGPRIVQPFQQDYALLDLGSVPGLPGDYAGTTFMLGDPNTLLIGGNGNEEEAAVYSVGVTRDGEGHITGFTGQAEHLADAPNIDGGLAYGPGDVLFYSRYDPGVAEIGQIKPGSDTTDKVIDLMSFGVAETPGALNFVPEGLPGEGMLKLAGYGAGNWYDISLEAANDGTFDVTQAAMRTAVPNAREGFVYVPSGSPVFGTTAASAGTGVSLLIAEYENGRIDTFQVDANGDPIPSSEQMFAEDVGGPDGMAVDPLTNDVIFTDFGGHRIWRIAGFAAPPQYVKGDNNCDGVVNALDALSGLQFVAGLPVHQEDGCQTLGEPASAGAAPAGETPIFGDVDCDNDVDAVDSLLILTFVAGLPVNLTQGCTPLETIVVISS